MEKERSVLYTAAQKRANKKWIENNKERSNEYHRNYRREYYKNNRDKVREINRLSYQRRKARKLAEASK